MDTIRQNWLHLQERIGRAATRCGRDPADIQVVAVTKNRSPSEVETAIRAGWALVGENRVQEAEAKKSLVQADAQWHLIGHLQANKIRKAARLFDVVQSVDSLHLAEALDQRAAQERRHVDVLVQVNTSGQAQQSGAAPDQVQDLVQRIGPLSHLRLRGLMTIGVFSPDDPAPVRACFARLRELRDQAADHRIPGGELSCLSMGMSGDFELAIAEGANLLRLGTAIFGPRPI
jgi:pyridoxal phosphate enzyme (YggS family)